MSELQQEGKIVGTNVKNNSIEEEIDQYLGESGKILEAAFRQTSASSQWTSIVQSAPIPYYIPDSRYKVGVDPGDRPKSTRNDYFDIPVIKPGSGLRASMETVNVDNTGKYNWSSEYERMADSIKKKSPKYMSQPIPKYKDQINIKDALSSFRDLNEKDVNKFILTGSVALFVQNKITRNRFKDVDIISMSDFEMDDDMVVYPRLKYEIIDGGGEMRSIVFNNVLFDIFSYNPEKEIDVIEVKFGKETYLCQDWKQIIMAKMRMIIPKMKDHEEIFNNCIEINFK